MILKLKVALIIVGLLSPVVANACSCFWEGGLCKVLQQGDVVFLGTVLSKQVGDGHQADGSIISVVPSTVRFAVTEAFRGTDKSEIQVSTTEGCCACGYSFQVGSSYLVFAHYYEGKLTTSICTPTQPAEGATALLRQLRVIKAGDTPAALFGVVGLTPKPDPSPTARFKYHLPPLSGINIKLTGSAGAEFTAQSGADGTYEFPFLPYDNYELRPDLPAGLVTREQHEKRPLSVSVNSSTGCVQDVTVFHDGRISGRVVDAAGKPVPGFVYLEHADGEGMTGARRGEGLPGFETGEDGRFNLPLLWPGDYVLRFRVKLNGYISRRYVYTYQQVIDLSPGQHMDDITMVYRLPAQ